jgi:hypothetical protein
LAWISVDDRLPDLPAGSDERAEGVVVLVACADGVVRAARWVDPPTYGRHPRPPRWEEYDGSRLFKPAVTHWMPLPDHPAGRDAGEARAEGDVTGYGSRWGSQASP